MQSPSYACRTDSERVLTAHAYFHRRIAGPPRSRPASHEPPITTRKTANGRSPGERQALIRSKGCGNRKRRASEGRDPDAEARDGHRHAPNDHRKAKKQQFETKKNEEFRALGNEVERYTLDIDNLETQQLELMEVADGLRAKLEDARAALKKSGL